MYVVLTWHNDDEPDIKLFKNLDKATEYYEERKLALQQNYNKDGKFECFANEEFDVDNMDFSILDEEYDPYVTLKYIPVEE